MGGFLKKKSFSGLDRDKTLTPLLGSYALLILHLLILSWFKLGFGWCLTLQL